MKNPLTKTELTGLIFLAVLIAGITACGLILKECNRSEETEGPEMKIEVIDSTRVEKSWKKENNIAPRKKAAPSKKKSGMNIGKKKTTAKKKENQQKEKKTPTVERKDPFSDTIPLTY